MNSSNTTSNNSFGFAGLDSLDDWLDKTIISFGIILPAQPNDKPAMALATPVTPAQILMASPPISECTPRMDPLLELSTPKIKYEPLSPMETPKIEPQDLCNNTRTSIDIQPFIKALSLLSSIQHQDKQQRTQQQQQQQHTQHENLRILYPGLHRKHKGRQRASPPLPPFQKHGQHPRGVEHTQPT